MFKTVMWVVGQATETLQTMESFLNLGADEVDIRTIQSNFTVEENKLSEMAVQPPICGLIGSCRLRKSCMLGISSHDVESSMPELRERYSPVHGTITLCMRFAPSSAF
jgi:hypothetical protein